MGKEGVARATLSLEKPALLLSAGFCGGIGPELKVGDLVVGSRVVGTSRSFPADPSLLDSATRALKADTLPFSTGTILTGDRVVSPTYQQEEGWREMGVLAVDMESAYLADWAARQGIPFLAIRVVSDTPAEPWAAEAGLFITPGGRLKLGALFVHLLQHPFSISRMIALARKLREATTRLTAGIRAFLGEQEW
jgi:nucleoside phosphorylase